MFKLDLEKEEESEIKLPNLLYHRKSKRITEKHLFCFIDYPKAFDCVNKWVKVIQLCPTLYNLMDYTTHGILQARILEWVAFPFSRGSSQPRDRTQVSHIAGRFFINVDHDKLWKILKQRGIPDHLTCLLQNLYAGQEATVRTGYGATDWFQIAKGVYCHPAYLTYM